MDQDTANGDGAHASVIRPPRFASGDLHPFGEAPALDVSGWTVDELDAAGARIPFGPGPSASVPASWAARVLRLLQERNHELFGALVVEAMTGEGIELPRRRRRAAPEDGTR